MDPHYYQPRYTVVTYSKLSNAQCITNRSTSQ